MNENLEKLIQNNLLHKKKFNWVKKGLVHQSDLSHGFTHASHPCIKLVGKNKFIVAFTSRDINRKSHIFICYAQMQNDQLKFLTKPKLALSPGEEGYFDCDGVISVCFIEDEKKLYLYYVGWQNLPKNMWLCDTGRSIVDRETLAIKKEFKGPVIGRDKTNPLFAAATAFHIQDGLWQTWYNSGIKWEKQGDILKHYYGIHYATSKNGIDWEFDKNMCIPFADEYEYAFGRPSVYYLNGLYLMWFAHRATNNIQTYRIGFAYSHDGKNWIREDKLSGLDVSTKGWDSEMVCYPYIFEHNEKLYMLYNGNDYGKTGFGLAVLENKF
jgi:hypothetical protein